jgi:hypothetical protein
MLFINASLDRQAACIGDGRTGHRAGCDGLACATASSALFAPDVEACDAMPSRDGDGTGADLIRGVIPSSRSMLPEP